jgi:C_GCAxxG_C_C family probable redox protein
VDRINNAVNKFLNEYACSQAILSEYCELFKLETELALKMASGFAGGMRFGKTCGAVTAAYMVIGLKFGAQNCDRPEGRQSVYNAVYEFTKKFEEMHGSTCCEVLIGCNISTEAGMRKAKDKKLFQTICPGFVKSSAELLEIMLNQG